MIVRFVIPPPVTDVGEKMHAVPDGSPEHENVTVPANPVSARTKTETGVVAWPFVAVAVFGMREIE